MTCHLILTRHAKSGWDDPALADHDRILSARGRAAATRLGRWIRAEGYLPDAALVSSAARTRETFARIAAEFAQPVPETVVPALYHAGPDTMLRVLEQAQGTRVMLVGHNPGIAELAAQLVADPPAHPQFARYPTGATLIARFDIPELTALRPGCGTVVDFMVPRELDAAGQRNGSA